MNHYLPRQRVTDSRWDYVLENRRTGVRPLGYCAGYRELDPAAPGMVLTPAQVEQVNALHRPLRAKFHDDGHATAAEACACYRRYLLDTTPPRFHPDRPDATTQHKCVKCGTWCSGGAYVGREDLGPLCAEHRTLAVVEELYPAIGEAWSSF